MISARLDGIGFHGLSGSNHLISKSGREVDLVRATGYAASVTRREALNLLQVNRGGGRRAPLIATVDEQRPAANVCLSVESLTMNPDERSVEFGTSRSLWAIEPPMNASRYNP